MLYASYLLLLLTATPSCKALRSHSSLVSLYLVSLPFSKHVPKFLQRAPIQLRLLPQIRCQEAISVAYSHERSLEGIF